MQEKLNTRFTLFRNHRLTGVLFLFLCCVFIATPVVNARAGEKISYAAPPLTQTTEAEEAIRSIEAQKECVISLRQKQKVVRLQRITDGQQDFDFSKTLKANSDLPVTGLIRPSYYIFLFLYTLF